MRSLTRLLRRRDQRGMTIIEVTLAAGLLSILSVAAMNLMTSTQNRVRFTSKETESLDAARTTLARITHEVRNAIDFYNDADCPQSTCVTFATADPISGAVFDVRYRYATAPNILYRSEGARNAITGGYQMTGSEAPAVNNVVNGTATAVFCRALPCTVPSEKALEVVLVINAEPSRPSQNVTLRTYATPRNQ